MARTRARTRIFFVLVGAAGLVFPNAGYAATCEAILGKWAWFIGGEVTVNRDGTFTQQSGNAGRWECNGWCARQVYVPVARRRVREQPRRVAGWAGAHQHGSIPGVCHGTKIRASAATSSAGSARGLLPGSILL